MSSNFYPSQTSQTPGLEGALNPQYPDAAQTPAPTYNDVFSGQVNPVQQQAPADPVASLGQLQAQWQAQTAQSEPFFRKLTFNPEKGTVDISTSQGALAEVMGQLTDLKTMKAAAMARVAQLRQQESSGSPILDALSQFAGGMAQNDPTMPGWVRALGQTNLAMGPQGIKRERMAEEQKVLQYGQSQAQMARVLMEDQRAERQMNLQEKSFESAQETKKATLIEARVKDVLGRYKDEVDKGRPINPMLIATELVEGGLSKERAIAAATQMAEQANLNFAEIEKGKAAEITSKQDLERFKAGLDLNKLLTVEARQHAYKMAELGFNRQTELEKVSAAASSKSANERKLPDKARETLIQINALDEKLDSLYARAEKFPWTTGPVGGRVGTALEFAAPDSKYAAERRAIRSEFERFVAQYVKAVQGGGNTISNKDIENAAKALPNMKLSLPQMKELMQSIKNEGQYQRDVFKAAYEADWNGKDKNLLGRPKEGQPDLPADFIDFLKKRPAGKGGEYNGKTYTIENGVPVEVR